MLQKIRKHKKKLLGVFAIVLLLGIVKVLHVPSTLLKTKVNTNQFANAKVLYDTLSNAHEIVSQDMSAINKLIKDKDFDNNIKDMMVDKVAGSKAKITKGIDICKHSKNVLVNMPQDIEKTIGKQGVSDLLEFLKANGLMLEDVVEVPHLPENAMEELTKGIARDGINKVVITTYNESLSSIEDFMEKLHKHI